MTGPDDWTGLLAGLTVETIRPRPHDETLGAGSPAEALARAGGVPRSAPESAFVVCVNDPDRATDSAPALRALRESAGSRAMTIVVATGSHVWDDAARRAHEAPLRAAAGEPSRIVWHDARRGEHVAVGPAALASEVAAARDLVGIGSVEPHWFAGLTGAHKTLTVGVMRREDIERSHAHALDAGSRPFRLGGNPVHEGFAAVVAALAEGRCVLALQHVGPRWFAGPPLACLADAARAADARWRVRVARSFDFVVAVVEPPLSRTLYQGEKGLKNNEFAVRDGGAIVLDAACEGGVGPDRFVAMLRDAPDLAAVDARLRRDGYRLGDHKAHRLRALEARGVRVGVVAPGLPRDAARAAGFAWLADRAEAAAWLRDAAGTASRGAVVSDAAHTVVEAA